MKKVRKVLVIALIIGLMFAFGQTTKSHADYCEIDDDLVVCPWD